MNLMARSLYAHKPIDIKYFRIVPDTEDERPRPGRFYTQGAAPKPPARTAPPDLSL